MQGTGGQSLVKELETNMPQLEDPAMEIMRAAIKIQCSQINLKINQSITYPKLCPHSPLLFPELQGLMLLFSPLVSWYKLWIIWQVYPLVGKKMKLLVTQSCPILCDPVDCSPPGSSVHGILQARILEWAAIPFSGESS